MKLSAAGLLIPGHPGAAGRHLVSTAAGDQWSRSRAGLILPTGAITESYPRNVGQTTGSSWLSSGRLGMVLFGLYRGEPITSVTFRSGTTGVGTGTHLWAALFDVNRNRLCWSTDITSSSPWSSSTAKTFTFDNSGPYVVPSSGAYYVGLMCAATTVPNLIATTSGSTNAWGDAPILVGTSDTGLTGTVPNPAAALTVQATLPWCYLS